MNLIRLAISIPWLGLGVLGQLSVAATPTAQEPTAALRVEANSVLVDVVVTDRKNRHLTDLTTEDFVVLENGIRQSLDSVLLVSRLNGTVNERDGWVEASPLDRAATRDLAALAGSPNLIILLLDYATIDYLNQSYVRDAAVRYVQERMGPRDLICVFRVGRNLKLVEGFTNDKERLVSGLQALDVAGAAFSGDQQFLADSAEGAEDTVERLASSISALTAAAGFGPGVAQTIQFLNNQMERIEMLEGSLRATLSYSREIQARPIIGAIRSIAEGVQQIQGRKTLVLFSEGFVVPSTLEQDLFNAVGQANRANVAVYAIDGEGLGIPAQMSEPVLKDISADKEGDRVKAFGGLSLFDRAKEAGVDQEGATLRYLTKETGGFYITNTNDFLGALERIDDDVRTHYLLAYRSSNPTFDGEFRTIQVEVSRPGSQVRARKGYWAVPAGASVLSAAEFRALMQAERERGSMDPGNRLPTYLQANHFLGEQGSHSVRLTVEIPVQFLESEELGGESVVRLHLFGLVQDDEGRTVSSFRGPSRVVLKGAAQKRQFLRFENQILLPPGHYSICVLAADPASKQSNLLKQSLRLEAVQNDLSLSSLVVSEAFAPNEEIQTLDGQMAHFIPSARRRFLSGEQLIYYFDVYGTKIQPASELNLRITLSKHGREVGFELHNLSRGEFSQTPIPHLRVARVMDLGGLDPGRYLLRAEVSGPTAEQTLSTQTSFEIMDP